MNSKTYVSKMQVPASPTKMQAPHTPKWCADSIRAVERSLADAELQLRELEERIQANGMNASEEDILMRERLEGVANAHLMDIERLRREQHRMQRNTL